MGLGLIVNTMYFLSNYGAGVPLEYSLLSFLANDILQFAGLSFILIGIFKKIGLTTLKMFIISIFLSLISTLIGDLTLSNMYLNQLLGNIIGTVGQNIVSCFPLMSWLVVPVCGMMFGENLIKCKDKNKLYTRLHRPAGVVTLILLIIGYITREGMFSTVGGTVPEKIEYLHASNSDIIILIFAVMFIVSILYFISKRLSPKQEEFIIKTSKNVTIIYLIQWALILSLGYINNQYLHIETNLIIALVVWALIIGTTLLLTDLYMKIKSGLTRT